MSNAVAAVSRFSPTHVLDVPGDACVLVEAVAQDGTATWFKLYLERDGDDPLFSWGADGKVRNAYTGDVVAGALVRRI